MEFVSNITEVLNKKIKEEKIISQTLLASKLNISPVSVNKWLKGGSIEISKIPDICEILNITPNELFGLKEDESKIKDELYEGYIAHPDMKDAINKLLEI